MDKGSCLYQGIHWCFFLSWLLHTQAFSCAESASSLHLKICAHLCLTWTGQVRRDAHGLDLTYQNCNVLERCVSWWGVVCEVNYWFQQVGIHWNSKVAKYVGYSYVLGRANRTLMNSVLWKELWYLNTFDFCDSNLNIHFIMKYTTYIL